MGKKGRRERKKEGEGRCAPAATATAVGHAWRAAAEGGARGRRKKERGKRRAGFAAAGHGASRWMGHALRSGVGLLGRGSAV